MLKNKFIRFKRSATEHFKKDCALLLEVKKADLERFETSPFTIHSPYQIRREFVAKHKKQIKALEALIKTL